MLELGFDDLRLFTRIATLGTLSAAARERNVPVSQVSRALSRIERQCGAQLVHRSTHGLSLSPEGETLLARALYAAPAYLAQHGPPQQPDDLHQHLLVTHTSAPHLNQWPFRQGEQVHSLAVQGHWRSSDTGTTAQMVLARCCDRWVS